MSSIICKCFNYFCENFEKLMLLILQGKSLKNSYQTQNILRKSKIFTIDICYSV